jgi:hypothetical protein
LTHFGEAPLIDPILVFASASWRKEHANVRW